MTQAEGRLPCCPSSFGNTGVTQRKEEVLVDETSSTSLVLTHDGKTAHTWHEGVKGSCWQVGVIMAKSTNH